MRPYLRGGGNQYGEKNITEALEWKFKKTKD